MPRRLEQLKDISTLRRRSEMTYLIEHFLLFERQPLNFSDVEQTYRLAFLIEQTLGPLQNLFFRFHL